MPESDKEASPTALEKAMKTIVRYYCMGKGRGCVIRVAQIPAEQPTFPPVGMQKTCSIWRRIWFEIKTFFGYSDIRHISKRHSKIAHNRTNCIN